MKWYRCPTCQEEFKNPGECKKCKASLLEKGQAIRQKHSSGRRSGPGFLLLIPVALLIFGACGFYLFTSEREVPSVQPPPPLRELPADACAVCYGSGKMIVLPHAESNCSFCGGNVRCRECSGAGCAKCFQTGRRCPTLADAPCVTCSGSGKKPALRPRVPEPSGAAGSGR